MRHGREHVHESHHQPVDPPSERARDRADGRTDHGGHHGRHHTDQQRDPQPVDTAQQQVPAHVVGPERVRQRGWLELGGQVHGLLVELDEGRHEEHGQHDHGHDGG